MTKKTFYKKIYKKLCYSSYKFFFKKWNLFIILFFILFFFWTHFSLKKGDGVHNSHSHYLHFQKENYYLWEKEKKLTLFLPITISDLESFILMTKSLLKNFDFSIVYEFIIVTPKENFEKMESIIFNSNILCNKEVNICLKRIVNIKLLHEEELLPELLIYKPKGWIIQQVLKLYSGKISKTKFILILDADLLCIQKTHYYDLIETSNNSEYAISNIEKYDMHSDWYDYSSNLLNLTIPKNEIFGVTPSILSSYILRELINYLQEKVITKFNIEKEFYTSWILFLFKNNGWTEFSLYYIFAKSKGLYFQYHIDNTGRYVYNGDKSIWFSGDLQKIDWDEIFSNKKKNYYFIIIQSNTKISITSWQQKVLPYIDKKEITI
jgi:hypothetical protein